MADYHKEGIQLHRALKGKIATQSKAPLKTKKDICIACTAGAAAACKHIHDSRHKAYAYTGKGSTVAVISDGSHVLGLGNIGAHASLPALEGKCALISQLTGLNAIPIAIHTQDPNQIVEIVKQISPGFGAVMLEDIEFPKYELITERLEKEMRLPVFHNDSQITATVTLAALLNALKVVKKKPAKVKVVIAGANVAGSAIAKILTLAGFQNLIVCDSRGAMYDKRPNMNAGKNKLVNELKLRKVSGSLDDVIRKADVLIGVSRNGTFSAELIGKMAGDPIVFALSRPRPEILPADAKTAGAKVVATGIFEHDNHVDNAIVYPWLIQSALVHEIFDLPPKLFVELAEAIADIISSPTEKLLLPDLFEKKLQKAIDGVVSKYVPIFKKVKKAFKKMKSRDAMNRVSAKKKTTKNKPVKKVTKAKPAKKKASTPKKKTAKNKAPKKAVKKTVKKTTKKTAKKPAKKKR
jgi:malate dehydrogenase (oxaloacetate-decarboxylating)